MDDLGLQWRRKAMVARVTLVAEMRGASGAKSRSQRSQMTLVQLILVDLDR